MSVRQMDTNGAIAVARNWATTARERGRGTYLESLQVILFTP